MKYLKLLRIEFKIQMTPVNILVALLLAFIPMINPMAANPSDFQGSFAVLGRMFNEALIYAMLIRLYAIIRDRFSADKNRAQYLVFSKGSVLTAKLLTNALLFLMTLGTSVIGAILIIVYWKNVGIAEAYLHNVVAFILTATVFYLFIAAGLMLIITAKTSGKKKVVLAIGWIFATLFTFIVLFVVIGAVKGAQDGFYTLPNGVTLAKYKFPPRFWFIDHHKWLAFVPLLNLGVLATVLYGFIKWYWVLPIIVYCLVFLASILKPLATNCKEYLTT